MKSFKNKLSAALARDQFRFFAFLASGLMLVALFCITIYYFFIESRRATARLMVEHIHQLTDIFRRIDARCGIIDFELDKTPINFLNVVQFAGSEVGSMRLRHPEKWQGPYLHENLTIQGKCYFILKNRKGYYIVPSDGVKLAHGKVIGKDIILERDTALDKVLSETQGLTENGRALISRLNLTSHTIPERIKIEAYGAYQAD